MKEFDELFNTFDTEGWIIFIQDVKKMEENMKDTAWIECFTSEELAERRGYINALHWILSYQESIRQTYQMKQEDDSY